MSERSKTVTFPNGITFHFDEFPVTIEAGDILLIPGGMAHEVISHNSRPFSAYKGSLSGQRTVTEHGDARGSVERLAAARGSYRACFDDYVNGDDSRLAAVRARYETDYLANVADETRLYPGIAASLAKIADRGRLAVITNKPERIAYRLLDVLGVGEHFTAIIGGDTCVRAKPDPIVLSEAAKRCGFDAARNRAVMIGDTAADVALGRAFGAVTIWCAWGYLDRLDQEPDFVAADPADLPDLV